MASRRSRLQIKPNIGGPKGSGSKPAPKTVDPKPAPTETPVVSAAKITNSPRKSATVIPCNLKETDQEKQIQNKTDSVLKKEAQQTKLSDSKFIEDSGPGIGRLTKSSPSLSTNTCNTNNDKGKSAATSSETNNAKEYLEKDITEISAKHNSGHVVKEEGSSSSKDLIKEQHTDTAKSTIPPRRSRFPKVTPNVTDAGKKRQRSCNIPVETSEKNAIRTFDEKEKERSETRQSASAKVQQEEMLIVNADEILPSSFTDIDGSTAQETDRTMSPQPFIPPRSPVKAASANWSFTASPIKQPQVNISRARTVSTSEAPVIKKPRRTKIDIPTDRPPDKTTVRMKDLIRWNPSNNPMKPKIKLSKKIFDGEKENAIGEKKPQLSINNNDDKQSKDNIENDKEDDGVDDVDSNKDNPEDDVDSAMPVPQVTIGPDGNIIINEKSLVVEDKSIEKAPSQDEDVIDETENTTTYASFRPKPSFKRWSKKETMKFYKALAMIGADFSLIQKVFPTRTRLEIKRKFKREEKLNSSLVEKVLKEGIHFDKNFLEQGENSESSDEEVKKERKPKKEKVKPKEKKPRKKYTKASVYKRNYMYYEPKSDTEEEEEGEEETGVENEKDDTTWQPPQSLNDLNVGKRESTSSSRRVVLSQEQKRQVDMTEEDSRKEIYRAVRLYPKYSPSSHPNTSQSSTFDVQVLYKEGEDTQVASSQPSQVPLLTANNNGESVTYSNMNDNNSTYMTNAISSATLSECPNMNNISAGNTAVQQSEGNPQYMAQQLTQMVPEFSNLPQINNGVAAGDMRTFPAPPGTVFQNVVTDSNSDQYVLVTVVPERNEETVIHIYKIPGSSVPSELGSSSVGPG